MKIHAIPRLGLQDNAGHKPLAGSRFVWFQYTEILTGKDGQTPTSADISRLSDLRPDICGLRLDQPRIMGILNVTPDSFSDGGTLANVKAAVARARALAVDADILDIGGESTRPGAETVSVVEEIQRIAPVIRAIRDAGIAIPISIDTRKSEVARAALEAGANMVNDVSALAYDPEIGPLVAEYNVPICLMHTQGGPAKMQNNPYYENVVLDVFDHLERRISAALSAGIAQSRIIVDPGIGFGKNLKHNVSLLRQLSLYHALGVPILIGASRKRLIDEISGAAKATDRMAGSLAVALHAAAQGVQIMRVHDTYETRQALNLFQAMNEGA